MRLACGYALTTSPMTRFGQCLTQKWRPLQHGGSTSGDARIIFQGILLLAKAYRMQEGPDEFFHEFAKLLLEVACVHPTTYTMLKKKVGFIIEWGFVTGEAHHTRILALQTVEKLLAMVVHYLSVLHPPHLAIDFRKPPALPALPTQTKHQRVLQFMKEERRELTTSATPESSW